MAPQGFTLPPPLVEEWCADGADDAIKLRLNMAENTPPVLLPGDCDGEKFLLVLPVRVIVAGDDSKAWRDGVRMDSSHVPNHS
jgi:hypothetical protein